VTYPQRTRAPTPTPRGTLRLTPQLGKTVPKWGPVDDRVIVSMPLEAVLPVQLTPNRPQPVFRGDFAQLWRSRLGGMVPNALCIPSRKVI